MAKLSTPISKAVALIRMLKSSNENESKTAGVMLLQLLNKDGSMIADWLEQEPHNDNAPLSVSEMQAIYDAAYQKGFGEGSEHGKRSAVIAAQPMGTFTVGVDDGVNGYTWLQIAEHLALHKHLFPDKQREFVEDMPGRLARFGAPTPKQADYLRSLFVRKFGGRI
jgi:hypothetical protein